MREITIGLTDEELRALRASAAREQIDCATWVRRVALSVANGARVIAKQRETDVYA